ncbi:zinc finger protein ZFP2-like isoform X1 [Euwallacea similis]|uniref:zinc finger protein ZFP2-like isoform X1 n=1 Tax=Euwallacea similis TaxID=1736056 RepID=UPI00344C6AC0
MLLSCPLCSKPHFEGVDSLRTTLINVATAPLTCPVCQESLRGLDKLTIHLFGHVSEAADKRQICVISQSKEDHETVKEEIDRSIHKICNENFTVPKAHLSPSEGTPQKPPDEVISCDICSFTFTDKNILEMHQKLLHQTSPDEKTGKYSYHCHLCSKRFRMRGSLMVHLRVAHYGFNTHINLPPHLLTNNGCYTEDGAESDEIKGGGKPHECKQWTCDVCAKMFTTKYFLKKHKRLHTGEMPYSCSICNKSFTFQQSYHKHMLYHSSEKPYVCPECGRAFKEHSTLQNHARIHSGERPFGCEICGKRFRQRVSYLVHMRIHTGVMPYKCTACNKSFRYKVSQKSHKCPMNPPGSVIKVNESDAQLSLKNSNLPQSDCETQKLANATKKCIMSVDYDTGSINFIQRENPINGSTDVGQLQMICSAKVPVSSPTSQLPDSDDRLISSQTNVYSAIISPVLPEVASLCLNNNSPVHHPSSPGLENIQVIREKCLEELFQ